MILFQAAMAISEGPCLSQRQTAECGVLYSKLLQKNVLLVFENAECNRGQLAWRSLSAYALTADQQKALYKLILEVTLHESEESSALRDFVQQLNKAAVDCLPDCYEPLMLRLFAKRHLKSVNNLYIVSRRLCALKFIRVVRRAISTVCQQKKDDVNDWRELAHALALAVAVSWHNQDFDWETLAITEGHSKVVERLQLVADSLLPQLQSE